jgi:oligopeptide transport system substrate-binding protein
MDEKGTRWTRPGNLVGNGAFTLAEWVPNARIVVVKNPLYWDAANTRLNRVEFYPIEKPDTSRTSTTARASSTRPTRCPMAKIRPTAPTARPT